MILFLLAFITGVLNGLVLWAQETQMAEYAVKSVHDTSRHPTGY
jgi:hypothetical protein